MGLEEYCIGKPIFTRGILNSFEKSCLTTLVRSLHGSFLGYFDSETDLRYHGEVCGNLFTQVSKTMDLLMTKYLKAMIRYEGIQRIETYPVPEDALREAVLNAVVHRDYAVAAQIQIRVYDNRLKIWNPGKLPENWSLEKLLSQHPSQPSNPDIANAFLGPVK